MKEIEAELGADIRDAISDAIIESRRCGEAVCFEFNGVNVIVEKDSDIDLLLRDWNRGMSGYLGKSPSVGPHPSPELSDSDKESDARIEAANEAERDRRHAEYEKVRAAKKEILEGALSESSPIELSDEAKWKQIVDRNKEPYGERIVRFAEEWARLMQTRIDGGESVEDCAKELSHVADDDGITGFMYGAAVQILSECWKHGEELRQWHNRDTQIGDEGDKANADGGVLNPALLNVRP